jgi:hypothetical protein
MFCLEGKNRSLWPGVTNSQSTKRKDDQGKNFHFRGWSDFLQPLFARLVSMPLILECYGSVAFYPWLEVYHG